MEWVADKHLNSYVRRYTKACRRFGAGEEVEGHEWDRGQSFLHRLFVFFLIPFGFPRVDKVLEASGLIAVARMKSNPDDWRNEQLKQFGMDPDQIDVENIGFGLGESISCDEDCDCEDIDLGEMCCYRRHRGGVLAIECNYSDEDAQGEVLFHDPVVEIFWVKDRKVFVANDTAQANFPHLERDIKFCDAGKMAKLTEEYERECVEAMAE